MKSMILVLSPEECVKLLNGDLSTLVRRKFSKDFVGCVYVYCAKKAPYLHEWIELETHKKSYMLDKEKWYMARNGQVVAKFWCDKVEKIIDKETKEKNHYSFGTETLQTDELEEMSCLNIQELCKYIGKGTRWSYGDYGYAIHITKLEIFDEPKEISDFGNLCTNNCEKCKYNNEYDICNHAYKPLTRAPSNYCYVGE